MNILTDTTHNLTETVLHYFCMRLKFRGGVLQGTDQEQLAAGTEPLCQSNKKQAKH